ERVTRKKGRGHPFSAYMPNLGPKLLPGTAMAGTDCRLRCRRAIRGIRGRASTAVHSRAQPGNEKNEKRGGNRWPPTAPTGDQRSGLRYSASVKSELETNRMGAAATNRNSKFRPSVVVTLAIAVLAANAVRADDWPQWRGPKRDGVWRETGILESIPSSG